jgi:hypothetical protein
MARGKKAAEQKSKATAATKKRKGGAATAKDNVSGTIKTSKKKGGAEEEAEPRKSPRQLSKTWRATKRLQQSEEPIFTKAAFKRTFASMVSAVDEEEGPIQALVDSEGRLAAVCVTQAAVMELQMYVEHVLSTILRSARFIEQTGHVRNRAMPPPNTKPNKAQRKLQKAEGSFMQVQKKIGELSKEERVQLMKTEKARGGDVIYRENVTLLPRHLAAAERFYDQMGRLM